MSAETPKVSVIVPLYNKEGWVARCVASILAQSRGDLEIIVVDDGSTDAGVSVVASFDDDRIQVVGKARGGVSSARNAGIGRASGEYIALIDADDEWHRDHLLVLTAAADACPDAVVICDEYRGPGYSFAAAMQDSVLTVHDGAGQTTRCHRFDCLEQLAKGHFVTSCSSTLLRTDRLRQHTLLFNEGMKLGEDVNFWIRLSRFGPFLYCDFNGARYHHDDPMSGTASARAAAMEMPDYFAGLSRSDFDPQRLALARKFIGREYLKNAYQNRGLPFLRSEMRTGNLQGRLSPLAAAYLAVRFAPDMVFGIRKKLAGR
jgi:GT2 family glycosyltransferase